MNVKEMIGGCIVCGEEQISDENSLIYCDGPCGHGFHQACYGVVEIPSGDWICRLCEFSVSQPKCELCPSTFGGFKPTGNKKWAHVICGLFLPEITFGDKTLMEPIILDGLHPEVFKKPCILCKTASDASYGACVTCSHPSCKTSFHVTCGQSEGLLVEETVKSKNNPSDPGTTYFVAYCSSHLHKQEHVAKNRANSSNMTYSYRIMPKIKLKDQLVHKSSSLNLSSSSSTTSSSPPSPASTKKKSSSGRSTTLSKADREPKFSSKDSRNNTKSVSKKLSSVLDPVNSFSPFTNGSTTSLTSNLPSSFSSEHSPYKSSLNKFESLHRKGNKHKFDSDSPSAKNSISTNNKSSKMDNTSPVFDISAKHRIVSPSTSSVNQPPRKRHRSGSTSSSEKSSSDDSSDDSDSESSTSSSSSSSTNHSRMSNRSRKSETSGSSSEDQSRPNSSFSSHSEEEMGKNKARKVSKKSQQIISETVHDSIIFPKTTAATSKKAKQPTDSAISSSNNTSSESLNASSIDKSSSGRTKSDIFSDKAKTLKPAKPSRTNISSTKKELLQKSSTSSLGGHTSGTKPPASSDSKAMSLLKSDDSDDETLEHIKRVKKPQKAPKPKKSANASNAVNTNRSSKKITSNKYVISGSSDESSDASDDEKLKYKSEDDSDNDFDVKRKSTKMPFNKKLASTEKKPKAIVRSRTASSSSSRKKSISDESKPIIIPNGRQSPVKKELSQASASSSKGKPLSKDASLTNPPAPVPARARRTSASRSPSKGKSKISNPQAADLKPDVESMETDRVLVGESDSNTMSSPLRPQGGVMKTAPFVVNHHDSRIVSPSVIDDSTMSSVVSPSHSCKSSFLSPLGRSTMEHSGLNIHIPIKSGTAKEPSRAARQHISPRVAATSVEKPPPQLENLFVPKTIEEFIEFQTVNTTNFLLSREENRDIASMMRRLNSLIQENSQTEKNIESLSKELNSLMTLNKELKSVEINSTLINSQRSQKAELANGVNGESSGKSRTLTNTSGSMITTPSISSSEIDSQSSCSMSTTNPTTFTQILNSKSSATPTPTLISSLNSVTPLAPTTKTSSSMIYSNASHQPLSTATLQSSNTSMANILAANNHFNQHGQGPYNHSFPLNSNHATNTSRSRQGEIHLSASLSAALYANAGVHHPQHQQPHHQQPQQVAPLSSHPHSQVSGSHPLTNLSNSALLSQLNQLVTTVPGNTLRHSSYQQLMGTSAPYEQQQQHSASNGGNSGRPAPLTRRNSGNLATSFNNHHSMANGVGTAPATSGNRPYDNSMNHVATNGGPNSSHFYNHN